MAAEGQDSSNPDGAGRPNNPSEITTVTRAWKLPLLLSKAERDYRRSPASRPPQQRHRQQRYAEPDEATKR